MPEAELRVGGKLRDWPKKHAQVSVFFPRGKGESGFEVILGKDGIDVLEYDEDGEVVSGYAATPEEFIEFITR